MRPKSDAGEKRQVASMPLDPGMQVASGSEVISIITKNGCRVDSLGSHPDTRLW